MDKNGSVKHGEVRGIRPISLAGIPVSCLIAFFFLVNSPLHPWIQGTRRIDSAVFGVVARMMLRGSMPYRDSFDHKGPVLYILNVIGTRLGGDLGLFVVELVFLTVCMWILYQTARLVCSPCAALMAVGTGMSLLFTYFEGGNMTEEYAMLFIAVSLYIFLDYFLNERLSPLRLVLCGACMGCVLMLRPNMIAVWGIFCLMAIIQCLYRKAWKELGRMIFWFWVGILVIVLPILIWLGMNGALPAFREVYLDFNLRYAAAFAGEDVWGARLEAFKHFGNTAVFWISLLSIPLCLFRPKPLLQIGYAFILLGSLMTVILSGKIFNHYGMMMIPVMVYPIANLFGELERIGSRILKVLLPVLMAGILLFGVILPEWVQFAADLPAYYRDRETDHKDPVVEEAAQLIRENTEEGESICVYGMWDMVYLAADRPHATRFSYQYSIFKTDPAYKEAFYEELKEAKPRVLLLQGKHTNAEIKEFAAEEGYELIWTSEEEKPSRLFLRSETEANTDGNE